MIPLAHQLGTARTLLFMVLMIASVRSIAQAPAGPNSVSFIPLRTDQGSSLKPEILTEAQVLEVDQNSLRDLGLLLPAPSATQVNGLSFVMNVSESTARSLAGGPRSKTLQNFQLASIDETIAEFRIASRVTSSPLSDQQSQPLDAGIDFQLMSKVSLKREISIQVITRVKIRRAE